MSEQPAPTFRLGYVPGATPSKWARTWRDRLPDVRLELVQVEAADAVAALERGDIDAAVARLPVDKTRLSAIALYEELPVVVVSRDHLLAATEADEPVTTADLADDVLHLPADDVLYGTGQAGAAVPGGSGDAAGTAPRAPLPGLRPVAYREDGSVDPAGEPERPPTTGEAIAWVAAGAGVTVVPMSLARLHHRKDVTHRVLDGGPPAPVGLVWVSERTTDLVDEFVGIVRGRTANSSRGRAGARFDARSGGRASQPEPQKKPATTGSSGARRSAAVNRAEAARRKAAARATSARQSARKNAGRRGR